MKRRRYWQPEEIETLKEMHGKGKSMAEVAEILGRPLGSIHTKSWYIGLRFKKRRRSFDRRAMRERIVRMVEQNEKVAEVAEELGMSVPWLYQYMSYHKLQPASIRAANDASESGQPHKKFYRVWRCRATEKQLPLCREKRCYHHKECPAFLRAVWENKADFRLPPDTHAAGRHGAHR